MRTDLARGGPETGGTAFSRTHGSSSGDPAKSALRRSCGHVFSAIGTVKPPHRRVTVVLLAHDDRLRLLGQCVHQRVGLNPRVRVLTYAAGVSCDHSGNAPPGAVPPQRAEAPVPAAH